MGAGSLSFGRSIGLGVCDSFRLFFFFFFSFFFFFFCFFFLFEADSPFSLFLVSGRVFVQWQFSRVP